MKKLFMLSALLCIALLCSKVTAQRLPHCTNDRPVVYFTRDISSSSLMKVYSALGQKIAGKVGIKISFGGANEQVLDARLLTDLVKRTDGTLIDCNGLSGDRWTSEMNTSLAKANGFAAVGKTQMLDEAGDIDMPLKNGYLLEYARTGKHFDDYDTLIAVHRFKFHNLPAMGGNIKNISLCLGSRSGKCLIHSGGKDARHYHNTQPDTLARAFADAAKAALDYKKNWAFINVVDGFKCEDDCKGAKDRAPFGIIASFDVVALDQCSLDAELSSSDANDADKAEWQKYHQCNVLEYAESLGCGKRQYRLVDLDK